MIMATFWSVLQFLLTYLPPFSMNRSLLNCVGSLKLKSPVDLWVFTFSEKKDKQVNCQFFCSGHFTLLTRKLMKITFKVGDEIDFSVTVKAPIGNYQPTKETWKKEDDDDDFSQTCLMIESQNHQTKRSGHWRKLSSLTGLFTHDWKLKQKQLLQKQFKTAQILHSHRFTFLMLISVSTVERY